MSTLFSHSLLVHSGITNSLASSGNFIGAYISRTSVTLIFIYCVVSPLYLLADSFPDTRESKGTVNTESFLLSPLLLRVSGKATIVNARPRPQ